MHSLSGITISVFSIFYVKVRLSLKNSMVGYRFKI
jgi:hypothetical protein